MRTMLANVVTIHRVKFFHVRGCLNESVSQAGGESFERTPFFGSGFAVDVAPLSPDGIWLEGG